MPGDRWHLKGDYFESCNCEVLCPCIVQGAKAIPTEGHCDVGFAFHGEEGDFNGLDLGALNFVVIAYTPGMMSAGDWSTAVYIDERADREQREALSRILSGKLGGGGGRALDAPYRQFSGHHPHANRLHG